MDPISSSAYVRLVEWYRPEDICIMPIRPFDSQFALGEEVIEKLQSRPQLPDSMRAVSGVQNTLLTPAISQCRKREGTVNSSWADSACNPTGSVPALSWP